MGDHNNVNLPPGFRFCPTDEELVVHFLQRKASLLPYHPNIIIPDLHLYPYDPWDLDGKAMAEGNKWYFYSRRTQNRITSNGYWNPVGGDGPIFSSNTSKRVGTKKYYMFYTGEPSQGIKTNWIMEEYGLSDGASSSRSSKRRQSNLDYSKWVVCRVYDHKYDHDDDDDGRELSCLDEVFLSLEDDFDEISFPN